jgi:hypothetical protein
MQHELEHALTRRNFDEGIEDPYLIRASALGNQFTSHMFYPEYYNFDELRAYERSIQVLSDRLLPEDSKVPVALAEAANQTAIAFHLAKRSMILIGDLHRNRKKIKINYNIYLRKTWALLTIGSGADEYAVYIPLLKSTGPSDPANETYIFAHLAKTYAIARYKQLRFAGLLNAFDDAILQFKKHQNVDRKFLEIRKLLRTEEEPKDPATIKEIEQETEGLPVLRQP